MSEPDPAEPVLARYSAVTRLVVSQQPDGRWRAHQPGLDWYVTADNKDDLSAAMADEMERRREADTFDYPSDELLRRHLSDPVPGLQLMDAELFGYLRGIEEAHNTGMPKPVASQAEIREAFDEAERRRAAGEPFGIADYRAWRGAPGH